MDLVKCSAGQRQNTERSGSDRGGRGGHSGGQQQMRHVWSDTCKEQVAVIANVMTGNLDLQAGI